MEVPVPVRIGGGQLPFLSARCSLCSGASRGPSSISSIMLPVTLALIYWLIATRPIYTVWPRVISSLTNRWIGGSLVRTVFGRWLERGLGARGFLIMPSVGKPLTPILFSGMREASSRVPGSLITASSRVPGSLVTCSGSQLREAVRPRPVLGTERAVADGFLSAFARSIQRTCPCESWWPALAVP